ncbi:uncharacterized protein LOC128093527 [Culex pipiens pallens]|uniref:uncharacterized protein LOC128093527 n=1 Tax=Culex pipiens pallens TaxID=42434 RepID=UPI0022AA874E|nr:uncharacterized protein LOC128093527 [Culex pipiens pallens]
MGWFDGVTTKWVLKDVRALRLNWKSSPGQNHMETRYAQKTYLVRMTCGIVRCRRQCTMRKLDKHARGQPDSRGISGNRAVLIRQPANKTQVHNNTGRRNFHVLIEGLKSATLRGEEADRKPKWTVKELRQGKIDQEKLTKELGVEDREDDSSKFSPNYERYQVGNFETVKRKYKDHQLGEPVAVKPRSRWKVRGRQAQFAECEEGVLLPLGHIASLEMPLEVFKLWNQGLLRRRVAEIRKLRGLVRPAVERNMQKLARFDVKRVRLNRKIRTSLTGRGMLRSGARNVRHVHPSAMQRAIRRVSCLLLSHCHRSKRHETSVAMIGEIEMNELN